MWCGSAAPSGFQRSQLTNSSTTAQPLLTATTMMTICSRMRSRQSTWQLSPPQSAGTGLQLTHHRSSTRWAGPPAINPNTIRNHWPVRKQCGQVDGDLCSR